MTLTNFSPLLQPPPVSSATAAATAATDNLSSKAKADSFSKASYEPGAAKPEIKSRLVPNTKFDKNIEGMNMV